jgi:FMN-dependent NADH-azoreductase
MGMLTHVEGSPNGPLSASAAIARSYIDGYLSRNPATEVRTIRVFDEDAMPTFGEVESAAKIAIVTGQSPSAEGIAAWEGINAYVQTFDESEVIVLSSPIWNFHVPWRLKLFFDVIVQPGMTFGFDENFQPFGMLRDRPVRMFLTSSSTGPDSPVNFQLPWLREIWSMMGLADLEAMATPLIPTPDSPYEDQIAQAAERAYEWGAAGG